MRKSIKLNKATTMTVPTLTSTPVMATPTLTTTPTPVNNSLSSQPITLNAPNSFISSAQSKFNSFETKFNIFSTAQSTLSRALGKTNKKKPSIDKITISNPTDYRHLGHVGIGDNDFKVNKLEILINLII